MTLSPMQFCTMCLLLSLPSVAGNVVATKQMEHPVVQVINMLEGLIAKAKEEGEAEELLYTKFVRQCDLNKGTLNKAISKETATIEGLDLTIAAKTKEIAVLTADIKSLEEQYASNEATLTSQTNSRDAANDLYQKTVADLTSTLTAISAALVALQNAENTTEPGTALIQKAVALIQKMDPYPGPTMQEHVDKYDFKSEKVIEMLKKLESDFQAKKLETEKEETEALNAFAVTKKAMEAMQAAVTKAREGKEAELSSAETDLRTAKTDRDETQGDLDTDTATLNSVTSDCTLKDEEWTARSTTRTDEIEAMKVAIRILSKVTGVQTEAPTNPVISQPNPVGFLQLHAFPKHADSSAADKALSSVMNLLRTTATTFHNKVLQSLADQVSQKMKAPYDSGVFDAIINVIEKMIFHLKAEQIDENEHKQWCDMEAAKTLKMKDDKNEKIEATKNEKAAEAAKVAKLLEDISKSQKMIADIKGFEAEATEVRKVGKKENKLALEDAEAAEDAVANAIAVLISFYKKSGKVDKEAWEFIQREPVTLPANPATWDSSYTGVADPKEQPGGIVTVMEKCASDFAEMAAAIKAQEAADQAAYEDEMNKCKIEKAGRETDIKEKTNEMNHRNSEIKRLAGVLKLTNKELGLTLKYWEDLQKACFNSDSSYYDRKIGRDTEIAALKQAEGILQDAFKGNPPNGTDDGMECSAEGEQPTFSRSKSCCFGLTAKTEDKPNTDGEKWEICRPSASGQFLQAKGSLRNRRHQQLAI